ncbi:MAG: hypothetical protein JSV93_02215 [Candidatus Omnitrophota bacterium]|nr:MAG: hypothetical protein JSV93_02215 [Candidatus Omnitrophota bacterium]
MGRKKRTQIKYKQEIKRRKRRQKLSKKGKNPDEYFYSGVYVSRSS